ncbi:helix-turn-helix domain-containing protein [Nocardia sp. NPDC059240]|uniref:helix-turn-helix domain-containing protein n=1 Tax=Nocardia sp. NPDC059240 TaxID=3346786 RepID=UPI0036BFD551
MGMHEAWTGADATALRLALGMSQREFAERTDISLSVVKKWASRGETVILPPEFGEMMNTHLDVRATPEQRAAYFAHRQSRTAILVPDGPELSIDPAAPHWDPGIWTADCNAVATELTRKDLMLDRRQVGRALLGVVVGANLLEPLERWLLRAGHATPDTTTASVPGAGLQEIDDLENAARIFREWDDQHGGGLRRMAVVGQLNEVNDLIKQSQPGELRRRLRGVQAHLAETAATMSWDSGYQALAQRYYVLAVRAAHAASDSAFAANALAGMARQLLCLGRASDALELVRLAQDHAARGATPTVHAMLRTREAWAYANLGRPSAFHRTWDRAGDDMAASTPDDDPHWIGYFDRAEFAGTIGGRLLEMAKHAPEFASEAAGQIAQAITLRRPERLRSSALDQLGIAEARLIEGEVEEACRLGEEALSTVEKTTSDRVLVKVREIYERTEQLVNVSAVAELRDRMCPLVGSTV